MAAFFYFKNDGTATGDAGRYATKQTGSFAALGISGYYASAEAAIAATTPPVAGDFVLGSDAHNFTAAGAIALTGPATGALFTILTVSDTAIDAPRGANRAVENTTTGTAGDLNLNNVSIQGVEFTVGDNVTVAASRSALLLDCKLVIPGAGDLVDLTNDGCYLGFIDGEIALNNASAAIAISGGSAIEMVGGSVTTTGSVIDNLFTGAGSGGNHIRCTDVNLAAVTGNILGNMGGDATVDDTIDAVFDLCELASGVTLVEEAFNSLNQRALFTRCSNLSAVTSYQYLLKAFAGTVQDDDTIRRADDDPFTESATDISYEIITNTQCNRATPIWFDFPISDFAELSTAGENVLRFFIVSATALTKNDIWIEVGFPDGTNKQTPNFISTKEFSLDAGTTLTTDSVSDWRDGASALSGQNEYILEVDTSPGNGGADCHPFIRIYAGIASTTINIASDFGLN